MVKEIRWSNNAITQWSSICEFYMPYSEKYTIKLSKELDKSIRLISIYPLLGLKSDIKNVRCKLILNRFSLIYLINENNNSIDILNIWDGRKDPELKFIGIVDP